MAHSHEHLSREIASQVTGTRAKRLLVGFLAVVAIATGLGMALLWPSPQALDEVRAGFTFTAPGVTYESARITGLDAQCASLPPGQSAGPFECISAEVLVLSGPEAGQPAGFEILGAGAVSGLQVGDRIAVLRVPIEGGVNYAFAGVERLGVVIVMTLLFVVSVLAVARWRGFWALVGLVISVGVVWVFILPALAIGGSGILIGLVGSVAIMFVVLYVAHGVSFRTTAALAGTLLGLLISTGLGMVAVWFGRLSGFVEDTESTLSSRVPGMDIRELMIAAMIVAGLGVLNDVTITQTSSVWELRAAAPAMSRRAVFEAGMRIGRDHIASTIYPIVFAYAGAALSTMVLMLLFNDRPFVELLTTENFGGEVLRTLASATGLVLSVPITTGIAALTIKPAAVDPLATPDRAGAAGS